MSECGTCIHKGDHLEGPAEKLPPPCNICDGGSHYAEKQSGIVMPPLTIPVDQRNGKPLVTNAMKAACIDEFTFEIEMTCYACYEIEKDPECEVCGGDVTYQHKVTVPWDTCKEIYKAMAAVASRA